MAGVFAETFERLAGKPKLVRSMGEARKYVETILAGRTAVMSTAPLLRECGIHEIAGVSTECTREACAAAGCGITSADYALAQTGTLATFASSEARLVSLLPPCHIAVFQASSILPSLDDLLLRIPRPGEQSSSLVFITGPSRTADIEMLLVRGVHGPGEIHAVILED